MENAKIKPQARLSNQPVAQALQNMLKETYALYLATHNYHWNVEGPHFFSLHHLFEQQYNDLFQAIDLIAERIRALDAYALPYQFEEVLEKLRHVKNPLEAKDADAEEISIRMIDNLVVLNEEAIEAARQVKAAAESVKDDETFDMMVERTQVHQKALWMLKSLIK
jgi:starvation-inducible DNA-binding protein